MSGRPAHDSSGQKPQRHANEKAKALRRRTSPAENTSEATSGRTCLPKPSNVAIVTGVEIADISGLSMAGSIQHDSIVIGLGLVAAPALVAIDPAFAPGPLLLAGQVVGIRHVLVEYHQADLQAWKRGLYGVPVGVVGALLILEMFAEETLCPTIGQAAKGSGLSLRSLYRYFADPAGLLEAVIARSSERSSRANCGEPCVDARSVTAPV